MNIYGRFVVLRAIEEKDLSFLLDMINNPEMEYLLGGYSLPKSKEQQDSWFKSLEPTTDAIRLIIETESDGAVGLANLVNIDWKNKSAFHGIKIASDRNHSKGIGTDTVMAVMRYAFDELGLNRLEGSICECNTASKALYIDKCGWKIEGIKRSAIYKRGKYHDNWIVSILHDEYDSLIDGTKYWEKK